MSLILAAALRHDTLSRLGGAMDEPCVGSKYHSPTPLRVTPTWLSQVPYECLGHDGDDLPDPLADEAMVWLCSTCYDNLRVFCLLMLATNGGLEWEVRREFGNRIRDLGTRAWGYYEESHV